MKKRRINFLVIIIIILFCSSFSYCLIEINDDLNEKYNLGDIIISSGYLLYDKDINADFRIKLECEDEEFLLMTKRYDLKSNNRLDFDEWLFIPYYDEKTCILKYEIKQGDLIIEEKKSKEFDVIKDLKVEVNINSNQIQLGESFILTGTVTNLNNVNIDGNALISIKKEKENYLVVSSEINNGEINKKIGPVFIPNGDYELEISVRDVYGNEKKNQGIEFVVLTQINPEIELNKRELSPGGKLKISGKILNFENITDEFNMKIMLNEHEEEIKIFNDFNYDFLIPDDVKSYKNDLNIEITDKYGNKGVKNFEININPVINELIITTNKKKYELNDFVVISVDLMDQAGDKINDEVNLIIKRGLFELFNEKIPTSEAFEYQIKNDEKSGDLRIIAKYESISSEKKIKVSGVQNIIEKGFDYITGDFVLDIKKSLKNLKYLIIGIIILTALILIFSHTTLKKEFRQIFKKKYKKAQDEIDHKSKLAHNLKKTVNKKHKEKHEIQRIAQQYVEKDVLASTIKKEHPKGGIKKKITSLFVDIRGYTKFAENAKDHELLKTLSLFFKKASDSIYRYNGSINQIAGDQVFAVFNVIKEDKNHILNAAKAALEIRNNFRKLNKELMEKKRKPIKIGIGINTGEALITHLGSSKKMTYTAVGNSVNIASRLQNSASSNQILITKNMLDVIKKEVIAKDLGYINLKNVSKPVNIFDVVKLNI